MGFWGGGGGGGGGVEPVDVGGAAWTLLGDGGVNGTFSVGIVVLEVGVAGVGGVRISEELVDVATGPGGGGSEVDGLADPGRTAVLESLMLGLVESAKVLCRNIVSKHSNCLRLSPNLANQRPFRASYQGPRNHPSCLYGVPLTPSVGSTGLQSQCSIRSKRGAQHDGLRRARRREEGELLVVV